MSIQTRLVLFSSAIFAALAFMVLVALQGWDHAARFVEQLEAVQLDSFKTAHQFRANLEELDYYLLQFAVRRYHSDWERFSAESRKLDQWIDEQRPKLSTDEEKLALDEINTAYDQYLGAARGLHEQPEATIEAGKATGAAFELIESRSRRLVDLAFKLVSLHRDSMSRFKESSRASLLRLRTGLFISLGVLFITGLALARFVWMGMIAPLRAELDVSRAIIERQEKLVSLGVLAAGVAHEIRNPLTAIKALLFRQQKSLSPSSKEHAQLATIGGEINRLENIVKHTLEFARPSEPVVAVHDVRTILMELGTFLGAELAARGVELVVENGPPLQASLDAEQVRQVLINLVRNAAESINGVGKVSLRASHSNFEGRPVLRLEVEDTGSGIPLEVQRRLFDPFFTTKSGGTGLGLAISARLVQGHGGSIQFKTHLQKGTVFSVLLPMENV